jgi:hypothetical protein
MVRCESSFESSAALPLLPFVTPLSALAIALAAAPTSSTELLDAWQMLCASRRMSAAERVSRMW